MKTPLSRFSRVPAWLPLGLSLVAVAVAVVHPARSDEVTRQVQEELRKRNLYFGDIDGRPSTQVTAALRRYQERKGFAPTGETDATTLSSLSLQPPAPGTTHPDASAAGDGTSTPPPLAPGPTPWPDLAVLRSDQARPRLVSNTALASPTATPTPAPPPSAAAIRRPGKAEVRAFLERYLQAGAANDTPAEMRFYANRVDYFEDGPVDTRYIEADVKRYDHRWPERRFTLLEDLTVAAPDAQAPGKVVVHCRVRFANQRPGYNVQGETDNVFTLVGSGPEDWRIAGMKEQRVRAK